MKNAEKTKVVISDCHLSAGRFFQGQLNPHEDFVFDQDMCEFFEFYSTGDYADREVELILAGDFFDYLNVPYQGEFDDAITEEVALYKTEAVLAGHPEVMDAIRKFAAGSKKSVTYLIGNHDAELLYEKVRERITREWDPKGAFPSKIVQVIGDTDRIVYSEGVEIRHGNQLEAGNELDFSQPTVSTIRGQKVLNLPWGSIYILKVVNRLKFERPNVDKIRPLKVFFIFGLILDPWFTLRFSFLTAYYFMKTRISAAWRMSGFKKMWSILREEGAAFQDLEKPARHILTHSPDLKTILFGHTHMPMDIIYPDGKQYINTGTWTRMVFLDWRYLGQGVRKTYALLEFKGGETRCELRQWVGHHEPHRLFNG